MVIELCIEGKYSIIDFLLKIEKREVVLEGFVEMINFFFLLFCMFVVVFQYIFILLFFVVELEDDDVIIEILDGCVCRWKGCGVVYKKGFSWEGESCVYYLGVFIFYEGSKGYSCCKCCVFEFDQFMKIEGCKIKDRYLFVGSGEKDKVKMLLVGGEEVLEMVR